MRLLTLLFILTVNPVFAFAEGEINNIDLSYFLNPPKLPWGVDPFLKSPGFAEVKTTEEKFVLNGVFFSEDSPSASINGKLVKTGDLIGDRHVEEIGENFVILRKQDSEIEINMPPLAPDHVDVAKDEETENEK